MVDLRLPNINGNDREQLAQIRSYLYQIIPQLQWALNNVNAVGTSESSKVVNEAQKSVALTPQSFDAEKAFEKLKPLIIKSADIVQAYYDEISEKLDGLYVAESDFGTYVEETEANFIHTSTYTDSQFSNVQVILTGQIQGLKDEDIANLNISVAEVNEEIGNLNTKTEETNEKIGELNSAIDEAKDALKTINVYIAEVDAHIRSGILYYGDDGLPVYGLEIGQRNSLNGVEVFNKYARFTADRLSFYDQNDNEVAYISDYKLFIRNVEITISLKIGGLVDTVQANGDVVTRWVGGEG